MTAGRPKRSVPGMLTAPTSRLKDAPGEREPALSITGLRRSYGEFEAVRGIDLENDHELPDLAILAGWASPG
jgi:hypothetical protein